MMCPPERLGFSKTFQKFSLEKRLPMCSDCASLLSFMLSFGGCDVYRDKRFGEWFHLKALVQIPFAGVDFYHFDLLGFTGLVSKTFSALRCAMAWLIQRGEVTVPKLGPDSPAGDVQQLKEGILDLLFG